MLRTDLQETLAMELKWHQCFELDGMRLPAVLLCYCDFGMYNYHSMALL